MVNSGLRAALPGIAGCARREMRPASVERIFATKAALTSRTTRSGDAEVVLAQPIHGLLRGGGGSFCRGELRNKAALRFFRRLSDFRSAFDGNRELEESLIGRGPSMQALTFFFAFVAVLALIGVAAWLVRQFAGNRLGANTNRGRMPRLAVIDAAAVDGRRRLVLVRRDNIEHLLMIGGPTDIVVEPNIVRAMPTRDQMPPRPAVAGAEPPPRVAPLPDAGWSDGDAAAPMASIMPSRRCPSRRGRPGPLSPTKCAARRRRCRNGAAIRWPASRRSRWVAVPSRGPNCAASRCRPE